MANYQKIGFNSNLYLRLQSKRIKDLIDRAGTKTYIEFGGKIVDDKHSARVLPGYPENAKLLLLKKICRSAEIVFVVSAKDIVRKRVRGDHKITYDRESIRVLKIFKENKIRVKNVVITRIDDPKNLPEEIKRFTKNLKRQKVKVHYFASIKDYPKKNIDFNDFDKNNFICTQKKLTVILSPGGGSGKFGVCLSQLYHELKNNKAPYYIKFETFPVYNLPITHPLNLAFMAASADFYDVCMKDRRCHQATSYNRDLENYELLHELAKKFPVNGKKLKTISSATSMGINMIGRSIVNDEVVQKEAAAEICRRLIRYKFEVAAGQEDKKVLTRVRNILKML